MSSTPRSSQTAEYGRDNHGTRKRFEALRNSHSSASRQLSAVIEQRVNSGLNKFMAGGSVVVREAVAQPSSGRRTGASARQILGQALGAKQPFVLRLDRRVALAGGPGQTFQVGDLDMPAAVMDEIGLLQG